MEENLRPEFNKAVAEIHPRLLLRELMHKLWAVIMVAMISLSLTYVGASLMYEPQYQTVTTFVVSVRDSSTSVYSNLSAAQNMASAFSEVLNSEVLQKRICEEMGTDSIDGTIKANVIKETNLLEMTVTASTPRQAFVLTKAILNNYGELADVVLNNIALDILQQPTIPTTPINYSQARHYAKLGAVAGAFCTAAYICLIAFLRNTAKTVSEVENALNTRLIATVYHEQKAKLVTQIFDRKAIKQSLLITNPTTSFAFVETFKKLRTRIEYLMRKNECKVLMVTSVSENEGKSTVAANIALAMNRRKKSILLIDADMRKPAMHRILGYSDSEYEGIAEYLSGKASLNQVMLSDKKRQLGLILGKNGTKNSTELIKSDEMAELIKRAKKHMDMVIIDTPPMSVSPDAELICELVDAAILVVRQDEVPVPILNEAIEAINSSDAKLLGCVFNNVYLADLNDGYNYGSGGKYGYVKHRYGKYGYGKYSYGKYGYGKYGYGKYGYGKYGYEGAGYEEGEKLTLNGADDGTDFFGEG